MTRLSAEDLADLRRWVIAGIIVVLAHGAFSAALLEWREPVDPADPAGAIVVEFAPEFVAAPQLVQSDAVPEKPIEKVEKEEQKQVAAKDEEKIENKIEPKPIEEQPRDAVPLTTPPPPPESKLAALPAGPIEGPKPRPIDMKAMQTWVGKISGAIERKKRYPAAALARREQGTAQVSFTLDRHGRVTESHIARSSGAAELDKEALALIDRAQPFPPWPQPESGPEHMELSVPILFNLK